MKKTKFILALAILLLLPLSNKATTLAKETIPIVKVNGKIVNNRNKLNLDTNENYITLKKYSSGCTLKTHSKKIKLKYWGACGTDKEWEVITKKSGKAKVQIVKHGKIIKTFNIVVKTPKLVAHGKGTNIDFELKNAGNDEDETRHKIKWTFTPVGNYGSNYKTLKEKHHSTITMIANSGTYIVKAKLLGKTYKLKKPITILECDGDFEIKSIYGMQKVLPSYITESLLQHHYSFSIVNKRSLDHFSQDLKKGHTISGIHDFDNRRIAVSNTSAVVVLHEVGHFISCSFQKVNGTNLTQTKEWQNIYENERYQFSDETSFSQVGDTYAATNANEFFAECFQQFYIAPKTLRKHCPQAYRFVERTMETDFPKIAEIAW